MHLLLPSNAVLSVRRTTRKDSVALKVTLVANTLLVPRQFSDKRVRSFIDKQLDWIEQSIAKQRARLPVAIAPAAELNQVVLLGVTYEVVFVEELEFPCVFNAEQQQVLMPKTAQKSPRLFKDMLKKALFEAVEAHLKTHTLAWAQRMGVAQRLQSITVKNYKSRWGSCTHDGRVQFNWRLAMFAPAVIEYVIVHELAHLTHLNHSKAFWAEVARYCPDYKQYQAILKQQGAAALAF